MDDDAMQVVMRITVPNSPGLAFVLGPESVTIETPGGENVILSRADWAHICKVYGKGNR